jgi:ParB family chromosome partitioning protein
MNERKLGRGLSDLGLAELLSGSTAPVAAIIPEGNSDSKERFVYLPIEKIRPGRYQPRKEFASEELRELANSIKSQGIIQPIIVRHMNDGYEIIAGERRWRAAQMTGLDTVPVIIKDIPDESAIAMSLIENIQRKDLNALEEAGALQRLIDEFRMTHDEVAIAVGKSRTVVTNLLRLQKLHPDVKTLLLQGKLEMGHARALLALEGGKQFEVATLVVVKGLSVRQTEEWIRTIGEKPGVYAKKKLDPDIANLQRNLSDKLSARVSIKHQDSGKGKLEIHYNSVDELEGILAHIRKLSS